MSDREIEVNAAILRISSKTYIVNEVKEIKEEDEVNWLKKK